MGVLNRLPDSVIPRQVSAQFGVGAPGLSPGKCCSHHFLQRGSTPLRAFPVGSIRCNQQVGRTQQVTTISCVYERSRIDVSDVYLMYLKRKEEKGISGDEMWVKHGEQVGIP